MHEITTFARHAHMTTRDPRIYQESRVNSRYTPPHRPAAGSGPICAYTLTCNAAIRGKAVVECSSAGPRAAEQGGTFGSWARDPRPPRQASLRADRQIVTRRAQKSHGRGTVAAPASTVRRHDSVTDTDSLLWNQSHVGFCFGVKFVVLERVGSSPSSFLGRMIALISSFPCSFLFVKIL